MIPLSHFDSHNYFASNEGLSVAIDDVLFMNYRLMQDVIVSGPFASFGGFYFAKEFSRNLKFRQTVDLLEKLINTLRKAHKNATGISIRLAPSAYYDSKHIEFLQAVFEYCGFSRCGDVSMLVDCKDYSPASSLLRNVNKAISSGLHISSAHFKDCFDRLAEIKHAKGYSFGLDRDRFFQQVSEFPAHYECFEATSNSGVVEGCLISINVADVCLLFAWDQTENGKNIRATDFLMHNTIKLSVERGCRFVDLGTVTEFGELRDGLVRHKEKFSSVAQVRNTYTINLS